MSGLSYIVWTSDHKCVAYKSGFVQVKATPKAALISASRYSEGIAWELNWTLIQGLKL